MPCFNEPIFLRLENSLIYPGKILGISENLGREPWNLNLNSALYPISIFLVTAKDRVYVSERTLLHLCAELMVHSLGTPGPESVNSS